MAYKQSLAPDDTFSITCKKLKFDFFTASRPRIFVRFSLTDGEMDRHS